MSAGTVVVGGGQAAAQLAVSLREFGDQGPITIVGAEVHQPYQRPPLSKAFLKGDSEADALALRALAFYERSQITVKRSARVTKVDLDSGDSGGGGTLHTADGYVLPFSRIALTVGARVRRLAVPGAELEGVCHLRDLEDASGLRRHLADAQCVVVIGGGFIGLEAAAVARALAKDVTVVESSDRLVARAVAPVMSDFLSQAHRRRGSQIRLNAEVIAIGGQAGRVRSVELAGGVSLPADLVIVGIGVEPRTELAEQMGLHCDRGIVVDEWARTSNPAITAAGDCTVLPNPLGSGGMIRLESVQNAIDQAKVAASTMSGRLTRYDSVPWFWSDQADLKLQIAGLSAGYDSFMQRGSADDERFSVLYYSGERLIAIDAVNRPQDYMTVRRALSAGRTIDRHAAIDETISLKDLVS